MTLPTSLFQRLRSLTPRFEIVRYPTELKILSPFDYAFAEIDSVLAAVEEYTLSLNCNPVIDMETMLKIRTEAEQMNNHLEKLGTCQSQVRRVAPLVAVEGRG
eukprot:PhF_6_TR28051/c0_g1_i2/m.41446